VDRNSSHAPDDQFAAGSKSQMSAAVTCAKLQSTSWPRPPGLRPLEGHSDEARNHTLHAMLPQLHALLHISVVAVAAASPILHASFRLPKLNFTPGMSLCLHGSDCTFAAKALNMYLLCVVSWRQMEHPNEDLSRGDQR
jgi:hypothetical protein